MSVKSITSYAQFQEILKSDKPVVIDFWATWCGPCKVISPIFAKFADAPEFAGLVELWKVDVDEQDEIAAEVEVRAMPTFMAFKNGGKAGNVIGADPKGLKALIQSVL